MCLAFAAILVAATVGIISNRSLTGKIHREYEGIVRPLRALASARSEFHAMRAALYGLVFDFNTNEQDNQFKAEIRKNLSRYEQNIKLYKEILDEYGTNDPIEREIVDFLYEQLGLLRETMEQRLIPLVENSEREIEAVRVLRSDFFTASEDIDQKLSALAEILEKQAENADIVAAARYKKVISFFLTIVIVCAGILCVATYAVVCSVVQPLHKISAVAEDVSIGNLRVVGFDSDPGGELGILAESFKHLTHSVINIVSDMQTMTKHHSEGDFDYVMDAEKYKGKYHDMVEGVNEMMQMTVDDLKTVIKYLEDLRHGGQVGKIKRFPGKKAVISDTVDVLVGKVYIDILTGIYNRRYMEVTLNNVCKTIQRSGGGVVSVLMMDVDFFKKYNDTYGHAAGDDCLRTVAQTIANSLTRADDFAARYGGEEFIVILPNTDEAGARMIAERILESVRERNIPHEKSEAASHVTLSIGITTGDVTSAQSCMEYVKHADEALYLSKTGGRNRCTFLPLADMGSQSKD